MAVQEYTQSASLIGHTYELIRNRLLQWSLDVRGLHSFSKPGEGWRRMAKDEGSRRAYLDSSPDHICRVAVETQRPLV